MEEVASLIPAVDTTLLFLIERQQCMTIRNTITDRWRNRQHCVVQKGDVVSVI